MMSSAPEGKEKRNN